MSAFGVNFSKGDLRTFPSYEVSGALPIEYLTGTHTLLMESLPDFS
jgi:hypothetical protein